MGQVLLEYFSQCRATGGTAAVVKFAGLVRCSSTQANELPDSEENIKIFEKAYSQINNTKHPLSQGYINTENYTSQLLTTCAETLSQREFFLISLEKTLEHITQSCSSSLKVERVSIWLLQNNETEIICKTMYERSQNKFSKGAILFKTDYAPYFHALKTEKTIKADNAQTDIRTQCFSNNYLKPLGIFSMLDIPIWLHGKMIGVVCCEHIGKTRYWTNDEENFCYILSNIVSLAFEREKKI